MDSPVLPKNRVEEYVPTSAGFSQRLLPQVVDQYAVSEPDRKFGIYALCNKVSEGFRTVTMKEMRSSVNHLAWWIKDNIGTSTTFETISFMGISDFRYPMICLAAIKCGFKILLPSTRSSPLQIQSLLDQTNCKAMFYSSEMGALLDHLSMDIYLEIPPLDSILASEPPHFAYSKTFSDAIDDPILVIHSSGTTGSPKIITMTNGTVSVTDNDRYINCPAGRRPQNAAQFDFAEGGGFYSCFPPYHLAGIQACLILPILSKSASIVIGPALVPPSGDIMAEVIRGQKSFIRAIYVPPSIIEQWAQATDFLDQARHLDFILYGGGPLPEPIGNTLSDMTDVCQMYGSAETGQVQLLVPQKGNWAFMEWNPFEEVDMQPSVEGTFEMVLHQKPTFRRHRSLSHNFPNIEEWRSGDLFVPHPTKSGLWRYQGRIDDLIVLSNGHKINPAAFETRILSHPLVTGALLVGTGKPQPALLLEISPSAPLNHREQHLRDIWPTIERANSSIPQYAHVTRTKVYISQPEKKFVKSPKGSTVRNATMDLYALEIEEIYSPIYDSGAKNGPAFDSSEDILDWVRASVAAILPERPLGDTDDFFSNGMDSLKVAEYTSVLRNAIRTRNGVNNVSISTRSIYQNPTIAQMAEFLTELSTPKLATASLDATSSMDGLLQRYSHFSSDSDNQREVILTGATGSLGSHLLEVLVSDAQVGKIYCLVRSGRASSLHGLIESFPQGGYQKVVIFEVDLSKDNLGLDWITYGRLISTVNTIVHLAWTVDFNMSLQSFENTHIRGVQSIIDLSIKNPKRPPILFSSSTAYSLAWALQQGSHSVPESILPSSDDVSCSGYGKSKQVAEKILEQASKHYGIPVAILRIGQMTSSKQASLYAASTHWPQTEWTPALFRSSQSLNLFPSMEAKIDWVPVDLVARIVWDIIATARDAPHPSFTVYNIVHPRPIPWASLVRLFCHEFPSIRVVSLLEWTEALTAHDDTNLAELERFPALKMQAFFRALVETEARQEAKRLTFSTERALKSSITLERMEQLHASDLRKWFL